VDLGTHAEGRGQARVGARACARRGDDGCPGEQALATLGLGTGEEELGHRGPRARRAWELGRARRMGQEARSGGEQAEPDTGGGPQKGAGLRSLRGPR